MKRNVSLAEISDGRLYKANDMVKADCGGCNGCSRCCHGMGNSIILDPYDVYQMTTGMGEKHAGAISGIGGAQCGGWCDLTESENAGDQRKPALIWMRKVDAASTRTVLESAGYFRWEDIMKMEDFPIFSRPGNVQRRTAAR